VHFFCLCLPPNPYLCATLKQLTIPSFMADIFEKLIKNYGPIGQHRERAHGYFAFPKLEGDINSRMKFRGNTQD
jgi:hypothetical protein